MFLSSLEAHKKQKHMFNCSTCDNTFKTEGALKVHLKTHLDKNCKVCDRRFLTDESLRRHMTLSHNTQEWNCNDCSFQAHTSEELRKHLRLKGHQPSHNLQESKSEFVTCYTCKKDFLSYWSLMNHRKQEHPSNKTCRYFLKNQCIHGVNCWYRHDEPMDIDSSQNSLKSRIQTSKKCDKEQEKDSVLEPHTEIKQTQKTSNLVFQKHPESTMPPDTVKNIMETLSVVLQKMNVLEEKVQKMQ